MSRTRQIVIMAFLVAVASILHIVESWIPLPMPVPGAKLGLANMISLVTIISFGWRAALYVSFIRIILGSLFAGNLFGPAFAMSVAGAIASTIIMSITYRRLTPPLSLVGVSVSGAVIHNLAQISVAAVIVSSAGLLWYVPYLVLFALPTGIATGMAVIYFFRKMPADQMQKILGI